jgi:hypothetical protein
LPSIRFSGIVAMSVIGGILSAFAAMVCHGVRAKPSEP